MSYREFRPHTRLVLAVIWTAGALTLVWTVFRPIALDGPPDLSWQLAVFVLVGTRDVPHLLGATALVLVLYFVLDTVPITWLLSSLDRRPFKVTYLANYQGVFLEHFGIELFGVLFAVIWSVSPWLSPLFG